MESRGSAILIVDDEPDLREMLVLEFTRKGFRALEAPDGDRALEILEETDVSAVVSDIRMPGLDGLDLLDAVKEQDVHRPAVLLMTAYSDISPENAYHRGAEAVFTKPFVLAGLVEGVRRITVPLNQRFRSACCQIPLHRFVLQLDGLDAAHEQGLFAMGRGGAHCAVKSTEPRENQCVELEITLSNGPFHLLTGYGVVRWVCHEGNHGLPPACGIEFVHLTNEVCEPFCSWVNSARPKAYIPCLYPV